MGKIISGAELEKIGIAPSEPSPSNATQKKVISGSELEKIGLADNEEETKKPMTFGEAAKIAGSNLVNTVDAFILGGGRGLRNVQQGVSQLLIDANEKTKSVLKNSLPGFLRPLKFIYDATLGGETPESYREAVNKELRDYEESEQVKNHPLASFAGELTGGTLATLPVSAVGVPARVVAVAEKLKNIPILAQIAKGGTSNAGRAISSGALQGAIAGGLEYDPTGDSRLQSMAVGGALGGGIPGIIHGAGRIFKGKNTPEAIATTQELRELSKEHNIDLTAPELRQSVGLKGAESIFEKIPGTGYLDFRKGQNTQFKNRAENIINDVSGEEALNLESGKVIGKTLQKDLTSRLEKNKKVYQEKKNRVDQLAQEQQGKVDYNNTRAAAQDILKELSTLDPKFQNKKLMSNIEDYLKMDNADFAAADALRSKVGDEVSKLEKAMSVGSAEKNEYRYAAKLFGALDRDIDTFADQVGGSLKKSYKDARQYYKDKVVPFKEGDLGKVTGEVVGKKKYDTDLLIGSFLRPDRPQLASELIGKVSNKSLMATRGAVLKSAYKEATTGEFFNPQKFAKEALRLGETNKVLFTDAQRRSLDGYSKLAQAAERASKFNANPDTGARLVTALGMGISGAAGAVALNKGADVEYHNTLIGFATTMLGARLLRSARGRSLLTRASHLPEKGAEKQWRTLLKDAAKLVGPVGATQPTAPPESEL